MRFSSWESEDELWHDPIVPSSWKEEENIAKYYYEQYLADTSYDGHPWNELPCDEQQVWLDFVRRRMERDS